MLECAALSRAMLIATSAPTGTTLQVPSPFGSENLIPHYRLLLATDDEYSDGMQVFVLSSETNKSSSSERVRCGEYENPPIPEMLGNRAMHEPHPEKSATMIAIGLSRRKQSWKSTWTNCTRQISFVTHRGYNIHCMHVLNTRSSDRAIGGWNLAIVSYL